MCACVGVYVCVRICVCVTEREKKESLRFYLSSMMITPSHCSLSNMMRQMQKLWVDQNKVFALFAFSVSLLTIFPTRGFFAFWNTFLSSNIDESITLNINFFYFKLILFFSLYIRNIELNFVGLNRKVFQE